MKETEDYLIYFDGYRISVLFYFLNIINIKNFIKWKYLFVNQQLQIKPKIVLYINSNCKVVVDQLKNTGKEFINVINQSIIIISWTNHI